MLGKVFYRSRLKEINNQLSEPRLLYQIAEAIKATRQSMYAWNSDQLFEKPDMQIAARLADFFNDEAARQDVLNWNALAPYDVLEVVRVKESGEGEDTLSPELMTGAA